MEMTAPAYYQNFHCIADRCKDNCCRTGWEIVIDEKTMDFYRSLPSPRREAVLAGIGYDEEGTPCIRPQNGQCPFLDQRGLCSIVLELGEEHIGDICTLHPRYREWFPGRMEIGVGLCCEEAARLILSDPAPAEFETYLTDDDPDEEEEEAELYPALAEIRDYLFRLAQDRSRPLAQRMARILRYGQGLQDQLNCGAYPETLAPDLTPGEPALAETTLSDLLAVHLEMEALEEGWLDGLRQIDTARLDWAGFRRHMAEREYEYEHLLVYFLFRYFLKAVYDENALTKLWQAVVMTLTMAMLGCYEWQKNGRFTLEDQIEVTRQYSKEVEYSDDNMETLAEGLLFEEGLSVKALLGLLEG